MALNADGKRGFGIWVTHLETKTTKLLYRADSSLRLIGWSLADESLIFANPSGKTSRTQPITVKLSGVSVKTNAVNWIAELPFTYYLNIHLSPDRYTLAYVTRQDEKDNLWILSLRGGSKKKLTANNDPRLYFSSLAWAQGSQAIYFGKQARHSLLSMITNFK